LRLFGSGAWGRQFDGTGRYVSLLGRRLGGLRVGGRAEGEVRIDAVGSRFLRSLPKRSPLVPSPVVGGLSGVEPGTPLALALNGRVAAVSVAYRDPTGPIRFSELPDELAFRAGLNRARMFAVSGPVSRPVLRELRVLLVD
jgi:hypothetical protein